MIGAGECIRWGDWLLLRRGVWLQLRCQTVRCTVDTLGWGTVYLESDRSRICLFADGEELKDRVPPLKFPDVEPTSSFWGSKDGIWNNWKYAWSREYLSFQQLDGSVTLEFAGSSVQINLTHRALGSKKWPGVIAPKPKAPTFLPPPSATIAATVPVRAAAEESVPAGKELRASSARGTLVLELPDSLDDQDLSVLQFLLAQGKTPESLLKARFGRRVTGRLADLVLKFQEAGKENLQSIDSGFYLLEPDRILVGGS